MIYRIADEYSKTPGSRYISEGEYSGEDFRKNHLTKIIKEHINSGTEIIIDLDGTAGYSSGFLEEAFGGLIREEKFEFKEVIRILKIRSKEEPYLVGDICQYLIDSYVNNLVTWDNN